MDARTKLLRASQVARLTGFSLYTCREHIKAGHLGAPFFLFGEWCVSERDYLAWLANSRVNVVRLVHQRAA